MDAPLAWALVVIAPLLMIVVGALFHLLARRPDLSVIGKAGWAAVIVFIPYFGVLAYVMLRPPWAATGKAAQEQARIAEEKAIEAEKKVKLAEERARDLDD